jgi:uncharacterized membrane protein YoaK (UPF0700 family)
MPLPDTSNRPNSLIGALLLAATGGLLDAVVFLNHGHVFANAMSGNVVFLGIAAVSRDWGQIIPHLVPIGGFIVGVTTSKQVHYRLNEYSVLLLGLAAECIALFALGWLPADFPHMAFTGIIAFVSAFQAASYRHVGSFSYNSTFVTGNLRDTVEGICDAISSGADREARERGLAKALDLGSICLCFFAGVILGAWAAPRFHNHSLWLAEPFLLAALLQAFLRGASMPPSPLKS